MGALHVWFNITLSASSPGLDFCIFPPALTVLPQKPREELKGSRNSAQPSLKTALQVPYICLPLSIMSEMRAAAIPSRSFRFLTSLPSPSTNYPSKTPCATLIYPCTTMKARRRCPCWPSRQMKQRKTRPLKPKELQAQRRVAWAKDGV